MAPALDPSGSTYRTSKARQSSAWPAGGDRSARPAAHHCRRCISAAAHLQARLPPRHRPPIARHRARRSPPALPMPHGRTVAPSRWRRVFHSQKKRMFYALGAYCINCVKYFVQFVQFRLYAFFPDFLFSGWRGSRARSCCHRRRRYDIDGIGGTAQSPDCRPGRFRSTSRTRTTDDKLS